MNKTDLVKAVTETGATLASAKAAVEAVIETMKAALVSGEGIQIVGFGTFAVVEKPARQGVNPATREKIAIPAKKVVKFKTGKELTEKIK